MGTGIQGIVDRLDTVDGTFTIESTPGKGTDVMGTVPIGMSHQDVAVATLAEATR
jgi:glucose-6-phosphate-specific signal transduction histidine kinase